MPRSEAGLITLAQQVKAALSTNANLADSPVPKTEFEAILNAFIAKRDSILVKEAELGVEHEAKDALFDDLRDAIQRITNYLDSLTGGDPAEMATIGQSSAGAPVKQPPGQPRTLEIVSQIDGTLSLDWKSPSDGGRTVSYRVERRERPAGAWETCGATNASDIILTNQPRGKEMEYRIVGFNSNGDSVPSNSVAAVL